MLYLNRTANQRLDKLSKELEEEVRHIFKLHSPNKGTWFETIQKQSATSSSNCLFLVVGECETNGRRLSEGTGERESFTEAPAFWKHKKGWPRDRQKASSWEWGWEQQTETHSTDTQHWQWMLIHLNSD